MTPLPLKQVHKALSLKDLFLETQNIPGPLGSCFQQLWFPQEGRVKVFPEKSVSEVNPSCTLECGMVLLLGADQKRGTPGSSICQTQASSQ